MEEYHSNRIDAAINVQWSNSTNAFAPLIPSNQTCVLPSGAQAAPAQEKHI